MVSTINRIEPQPGCAIPYPAQENRLPKYRPIKLMKMLTIFGSGGTERQVINLAKGLDDCRFDLRFACLSKWGQYLQDIEARGIQVEEFPIKSLYKPHTLLQQTRLARYIKDHGTEIFHSYNFYSNVFAMPAAKMAGVPLIVASIRDCGVNLSPTQKTVQRLACRLANRILVNAASIRDWLIEEGYPGHKITIIRNGLDLATYRQCDGTAVRGEFGIPPAARIVLMLARLDPQKGIDTFIKAAALVSRSNPDTHFLVVGERVDHSRGNGGYATDHSYQQQLRKQADSSGLGQRLQFTGYRSDVPQLLSQAAVSVLPSLSEGLSNTLLESMAAGVPIVATQVGGNLELVQDGVNGLLVPVHDPDALAAAIARILDNPSLATRFSACAGALVRENYSLERMVTRTAEFYIEQLASVRKERRHAREV